MRSSAIIEEFLGACPARQRLALTLIMGLMLLMPLAPSQLTAQALPFHTETAITTGFEQGAARTFSAFFGRDGLRLDGAAVPDPMQRDIDVFVQPFAVLPYAITPMWTTRIVAPFVHKSMDFTPPAGTRQSYSTSGIGDVLVDTKWVFLSRNKLKGTTRLGIEGGVRIPVGKTGALLPGGAVAPRPLQVGSGYWSFPFKALFTLTRDRLGFLANAGYQVNASDDDFTAGDVFSYDAALGFRLAPGAYNTIRDKSLMVYLELNGTISERDDLSGLSNPNSGGHLVFLSPDLQWIPTPWLLFEASVQFPVVQDLNGTQLEYGTRFQVGTRVRFSSF